MALEAVGATCSKICIDKHVNLGGLTFHYTFPKSALCAVMCRMHRFHDTINLLMFARDLFGKIRDSLGIHQNKYSQTQFMYLDN